MFSSFGIKDLIDIVLVAFFMYQTYKLMRSSGNLAIFSGIVSVIVLWLLVSQVLEMRLIGVILDKFISVGFILLVIIFQDEIRRFLAALGSSKGWRFLYRIFERKHVEKDAQKYIAPLVMACINMGKSNTGALIVIQQEMDLTQYIQTGEKFRAEVNPRLVENIFFKNSPLHDGAMIIVDNEIRAAECILPVAHNAVIPKEMGLRHRSGLGMSIETDAIVIIVSEERGSITVARNGKLSIDISAEELQRQLSGEFPE
ncbi:MAG: diadenylate cyclase CdaA [Tannerella sp.]|jgi:uncharacterized protein (TIGR00159 family)|nr:diadenylate cyclase CdaA [Tannerella sp.]